MANLLCVSLLFCLSVFVFTTTHIFYTDGTSATTAVTAAVVTGTTSTVSTNTATTTSVNSLNSTTITAGTTTANTDVHIVAVNTHCCSGTPIVECTAVPSTVLGDDELVVMVTAPCSLKQMNINERVSPRAMLIYILNHPHRAAHTHTHTPTLVAQRCCC